MLYKGDVRKQEEMLGQLSQNKMMIGEDDFTCLAPMVHHHQVACSMWISHYIETHLNEHRIYFKDLLKQNLGA
jgi:hypothetical protein